MASKNSRMPDEDVAQVMSRLTVRASVMEMAKLYKARGHTVEQFARDYLDALVCAWTQTP